MRAPRTAPPVAASRRAGERGGIQSLQRAAAILSAVAHRPNGTSLAELSDEANLHTSTAYHLAQTLVKLGYLARDAGDKRYRIGGSVFALAAAVTNENTLVAAATPLLERLSAESREAAHLAVRSGSRIIVVARTAAPGLLQLSDRIGSTRPAHATAIGKALFSAMAPGDLERLTTDLDLPRFTDRTITNRAELLREVRAATRAGVAYDHCEFDPEVRCAAVPVFDFSGRCAGAIGLSGPSWRLTAKRLRASVSALRAAGEELSRALGATGGQRGSELLPRAGVD